MPLEDTMEGLAMATGAANVMQVGHPGRLGAPSWDSLARQRSYSTRPFGKGSLSIDRLSR